MRIKNIAAVTTLKLTISGLFVWYLVVVEDLGMLPLMVDQERYIFEISNIQGDLGHLFLPDSSYSLNRTLYPRFIGLISWIIPSNQDPIVVAVFANTILHVTIAYYGALIYRILGGKRVQICFYVLAFSPTLTIYSLFAIRDVMIVACATFFLARLLSRKFVSALFAVFAMTFLRPFQVSLCLLWTGLYAATSVASHVKQKRAVVSISALVAAAMALYFAANFAPPSIAGYAARGVEWNRVLVNAVGLETFFGNDTGVRVSQAQNNFARIVMFDSVLLPVVSMWLFLRNLFSYYFKSARSLTPLLFASAVVSISALIISYTYIAIQDGLAFRKILVLLPIMWIVVLLHREQTKSAPKIVAPVEPRRRLTATH